MSQVGGNNLAVKAPSQLWQTFIITLHQRQDVAFLWQRWMRTSCRHWCVLIVCVCLCVSLVLTKSFWEIPDPNSLLAKQKYSFLLSHSFFFLLVDLFFPPYYVLFTPLEVAWLALFFLVFQRPTLTRSQHVFLHPTAVFIIPAFACIPHTESLFCLERQKKTVMSTAPPTSSPDGRQCLHMHLKDGTHKDFRDIQLLDRLWKPDYHSFKNMAFRNRH